MQGGIYNAALFGASQREARGKLDQMAGIKRPSGILASSPQLMQAAAPAMTPRQPMPMPQPMMQPAPVPMGQPALPQVPMQTAVAPMAPVQQPVRQAPAPRPMAQPQAPRPAAPGPAPIRMQEGGPVDVSRAPMAGMGGASPQMIKEASKEFIDYVRGAGSGMFNALVSRYGGADVAERVTRDKAAKVQEAAKTEDQGAIVDASMDALELPNTDAAKQEVARTVFGMENVNDIDEINRRIANVAVASAIGKGPDEFAKAVMLGLNNYKQTAAARAAAAGGSGGAQASNYRNAKNAYQDAFTTAMGASDIEVPEGMTKEEYATQFAETIVRRTYTPEEIAAAGVTMGPSAGGNASSLPVVGVNPDTGQKIARNPDGSGGFVDAVTGEPI